MNQTNPIAEGEHNERLKQRYQFTKGSQVVDLFGPIHGDIFFQDRLLLNGVSLKLKFHRSKNAFLFDIPPCKLTNYGCSFLRKKSYSQPTNCSDAR